MDQFSELDLITVKYLFELETFNTKGIVLNYFLSCNIFYSFIRYFMKLKSWA